MGLSVGELLRQLQKISGKLPKTQLSSFDYPLDRLMNLISAPEHIFIPELEVPDYGVEVDVDGFLILVKVPYDKPPVKMNLDRPVTNEYTVVYPGMGKIIGRFTRKLYLQAPTGYSSKAVVEALRVG
jgi:hypothetical protein